MKHRKPEFLENKVLMWTDGSSKGNPGPGGWAAILTFKNSAKIIGGFSPNSTNNRMELEATINGLQVLKRSSNVVIFTDSNYVITGGTKVLRGGMPNTHVDAWQVVRGLTKMHNITFEKTKAHADDLLNGLADNYAGKCASKQISIDEYYSDLTQLLERATRRVRVS